MLSINTNISSLIAQGSMKQSTNKLNQAIERMTTGFKINHAKDNAANYSIATNMTTKMNSYMVAQDNVAMGLDMINTASENLSLIEDKLVRLRALATQASNGTYGEHSLNAINAEANALVDEIERIYNNSEYNGINLMKGRIVGTEESKFIKDIDRRDTSNMTTLASVDETKKLKYGTYSISTAEELAKLATMTNNGLIGANTEFVLANDIDLSGYANWTPIGLTAHCTKLNTTGKDIAFTGVFDGNGYSIKNLTSTSTDTNSYHIALFGMVRAAEIKNLAIENCNIKCYSGGASLIGYCTRGKVDNCYTSGTVDSWSSGGVISGVAGVEVNDTYTTVSVTKADSGGFIFSAQFFNSIFRNCYVMSSASSTTHVFGFVTSSLALENCGYNSYYDTIAKSSYGGSGQVVSNNLNSRDSIEDLYARIITYDKDMLLQVGINSSESSQIVLDTDYNVGGVSMLRNIGTGIGDFLSMIDKMLYQVSSKQTEYGAVQNRLESALDEIATQYENLASSRSTIRDADIAEVSSHYIQQQILQQASATLLATANQSPSIALQLL